MLHTQKNHTYESLRQFAVTRAAGVPLRRARFDFVVVRLRWLHLRCVHCARLLAAGVPLRRALSALPVAPIAPAALLAPADPLLRHLRAPSHGHRAESGPWVSSRPVPDIVVEGSVPSMEKKDWRKTSFSLLLFLSSSIVGLFLSLCCDPLYALHSRCVPARADQFSALVLLVLLCPTSTWSISTLACE